MIDINLIRTNPELVRENIKKKFQDEKLPIVDKAIELDSNRRAFIVEGDKLRADRNVLSKKVGELMKAGKRDEAEEVKAQVKADAQRLAELEKQIENGTLIELLIPYETELHFLYSRENYGKPQPPCIYSTKEWIYNVRHDGKAWFSVAGRGIGYFGEYLHEIGKTVFLTKAEAEKKLKELQNER